MYKVKKILKVSNNKFLYDVDFTSGAVRFCNDFRKAVDVSNYTSEQMLYMCQQLQKVSEKSYTFKVCEVAIYDNGFQKFINGVVE